MRHSPALAGLIEALRALPGVGPKSAQRMAFHLLQEARPAAQALSGALTQALERVRGCRRCRMRLFAGAGLDGFILDELYEVHELGFAEL